MLYLHNGDVREAGCCKGCNCSEITDVVTLCQESLSHSPVVGQWYVGYLFWAAVLRRILSSAVFYCGAQLHSQIFSTSMLLWCYFNLSRQIMSETSMSSIACKLWIWTSWWNVSFFILTGDERQAWSTKMISNFSYSSVLEGWFLWTTSVVCWTAWTYKITGTCLCAAPAGAC